MSNISKILLMLIFAPAALAETIPLTVAWDAPEVAVEGYHLWEAPASGGLYVLRDDEIAGAETQYHFLIEIEPGQSRYFVLTAFGGGQESDYSNEVSYSHPFPVGPIPAPLNVRMVGDAL